jgi:hypothetical protein
MESTNKRKANVFINTISPDKENTQKSNVVHDTHSKSTKRRPLSTIGDVNLLNPSSTTHSIDVFTMEPSARPALIDITNSK